MEKLEEFLSSKERGNQCQDRGVLAGITTFMTMA